MSRLMFTDGPDKRAHTESSPAYEQHLDSRHTDMLLKENQQLKKLLEQRDEDMQALVEKC